MAQDEEKFYYKIGELEAITGIPSNKIRYWTKKYEYLADQLRENTNGIHKLYHKNSIEIIYKINGYLNEVSIKMDDKKINEKLENSFRKNKELLDILKDIRNKLEKILNTSKSDSEPIQSNEIINKIKEVLDSKIRPAVAKDGGDITFKSFVDGVVTVELKGSCSGCPSSIMTLKQGVQNLLCHYIPEVKTVEAV